MYRIEISSKVKRIIKKMTSNEMVDFKNFVALAEKDPFDKKLKTHKLKGKLGEYYSARLNYSDRVIFFIVDEEELIVIDLGNHDEVY